MSADRQGRIESAVGMANRFGLLKELWLFMKVRKRWWLAPMLVLLVMMGALLVLSQGSPLAPFIYALF